MDEGLRKGIHFFSPSATPRHRRVRLVVITVLFVAALALIWPIYPLFAGVHPLVLGLPLSFAWVVFWLLVVFAAFAWLYRTDYS